MGKKRLSAWKALLLLHLLQQFTAINSTAISEATASAEVEAESSLRISQPEVEVQPEAPAPRVVIQTSSMSQSQGYPPTASRRQHQPRPRFQVSHQRYRMDPYNIMKPTMMAQDRIFNEVVTAATIVPKLFGYSDKPLWVPHKYFNLCPMVDPNSDSMWALGCQGFPNQVSNGQQVPWASQQATAGAGGAGGWTHAGMTPFMSPFNMAPNNVLGFPPGFLGFPSMYPYYANPNPGMPPPAFPSFVSNEEGTNIDMGNLWTSSGPSSTGTGSGSSSTTLSSMFFNSLGMGGNPAAGASAVAGSSNGNQMNGMAMYSGTGYGGGGMGGAPPMTQYPFQYAIGILPMGYGYDDDYGTGWPNSGAWAGAGGWNRNEMNSEDRRSSSSSSSVSANAKAGSLGVNGDQAKSEATTGTE